MQPIVCHMGKCVDKEREYLDECLECDLSEQIERELLRENLKEN